MAKHPHYDVMMEWAADTSKVVQCRFNDTYQWMEIFDPNWESHMQYRIKPEKKPDVVAVGIAITDLSYRGDAAYQTKFRVSEHYEKDNIRLTFDGETGKLIKAEVLHAE